MVISFCFICAENYIFTYKETNNSKHFKRKTKVFSIKTKTNETPISQLLPETKSHLPNGLTLKYPEKQPIVS
ncbi:hypothetical protein B5F99_06740 [Odoribacter splanchnicus]|nr:hypothetical protein B5F99_06740 [Odoribacter splanchnicus]